MISVLLLFALLSNSINLVIPKIISHGIDSYGQADFSYSHIILLFLSASLLILIFAFLQSIFQTYASERVARDLRSQLSEKISRQSYSFIQQVNPSKLLTNLTSDADSVKMFVSMAIVSVASSLFIIIGASAKMDSVWGFSDAMILAMVFPNMIGLLFLFPVVKQQLVRYEDAIKGHK